jgi:hypothetical protein
MKIKKSKKGAILFNITLVFVTVIVLTTAFFVLANKRVQFPSGIGGRQVEIIKTYQESDKILLYVDQAAKFSVDQSVYNLGLQGGHYSKPVCGENSGYFIWQKSTTDCYPNAIETFGILINKEMDKHLNNYPPQTGLTIPKDNYEFTIHNDKVIGIALENVILTIFDSKFTSRGLYYMKPSFVVDFVFDIDQYEDIIIQTKVIFGDCESEPDKKQCVDNILLTSTYSNWQSTNSGDVFLFDVNTNEKVWIYDGTDLKEEDIVIKFGLDFN